jgi:hypothetical protein
MTKLSNNYNLQKLCPDLAKEWHPTKNGSLTPRDVTPYSNKKVCWRCNKNKSHEWGATIYNRNRGTGCPYCFRNKSKQGKRLLKPYGKLWIKQK